MEEDKKKTGNIRKISIDKITGKQQKKVKIDKGKLKAFIEKKLKKEEVKKEEEKSNIPPSDKQDMAVLEKDLKTKPVSHKSISSKDQPPLKESKKEKEEIEGKKKSHKNNIHLTELKETKDEKLKVSEEEKKVSKPKFETYEIKNLVSQKAKVQEKKQTKPIPPPSKKEEPKEDEAKKIFFEKKEGVEYKKIRVSTALTVRDLSEKIGVKPTELIKKLMSMGVFATITQRLDEDVAAVVSLDYGYELEFIPDFEDNVITEEIEKDDPSKLKTRPPVITIMGHVDHGKTTLIDAIRDSNIVDKEAGQITQHIGAYMVTTNKGSITVIDTPGHEAFTAMRACGAKVTDIVILVVSAVDGVMPQTVEAINHARAANVPIIVAINKIDLPQAKPDSVKQQLSNYDLIPEEWGGKTPMVEISAKNRINIDKLLELILLQAEIMELKANYDASGVGVIIEAKKDSKRGILATVICTRGRIKIGDIFVVGTTYGKVRALIDDKGNRLKEITPSMPAEILGINDEIPLPGDILKVVDSEKKAKDISFARKQIRKDSILNQKNISLLSLKSQIEHKMIKNLNIILKTDVYGSLQAIRDSLEKFANPEVAIRILHTGIGDITDSDVELAKSSNAIIFGFNIKASDEIMEKAKEKGVEIRIYKIIYDLFEDLRAALNGMLEPEIVDVEIGKAEIKKIFNLSSGEKVCGSYVVEGKVSRNALVKIMRNNEVIGEGRIAGLKRFKDDVKEVEKGFECGILIEGFKEFAEGDVIVVYIKEERIRRIDELEKR
jgi:translation initiation factor IF-2